jgi:peptidyl-prolyl cis-trans isomerase C
MFFVLAFFITAAVAGCGDGGKSGNVVIDINGKKITESDIQFLGEANPRIRAQLANPSGRDRIMENLVEQELLYQEAVKKGVNRDPKVKEKLELYRKVIIAQSLIDNEVIKASKKYYEDNPDEFKKIQMSQILVKYFTPEQIKAAKKEERSKMHTEEEALGLIEKYQARIDQGAEFETVAKEESEDIATKSRGGDLGFVSKDDKRLENRGYAPLLEKAFTMTVGSVGGPIKTTKGYHLIKVTKGIEVQPFEEVEEAVSFKVRGDAKNDLLAKLKKEATITYPEKEARKQEMLKLAKDAQAKKDAEAKKDGNKATDAEAEKKTPDAAAASHNPGHEAPAVPPAHVEAETKQPEQKK